MTERREGHHLKAAVLDVINTAEQAADRVLILARGAATAIVLEGTAAFERVVGALELVPIVEEGLVAVSRVLEATGRLGGRVPSLEKLRVLMRELADEMDDRDAVRVSDTLVSGVIPELETIRSEIGKLRKAIARDGLG